MWRTGTTWQSWGCLSELVNKVRGHERNGILGTRSIVSRKKKKEEKKRKKKKTDKEKTETYVMSERAPPWITVRYAYCFRVRRISLRTLLLFFSSSFYWFILIPGVTNIYGGGFRVGNGKRFVLETVVISIHGIYSLIFMHFSKGFVFAAANKCIFNFFFLLLDVCCFGVVCWHYVAVLIFVRSG